MFMLYKINTEGDQRLSRAKNEKYHTNNPYDSHLKSLNVIQYLCIKYRPIFKMVLTLNNGSTVILIIHFHFAYFKELNFSLCVSRKQNILKSFKIL